MWFLSDVGRLKLERSAIEKLDRDSEWLVAYVWTFDSANLCLEADIQVLSSFFITETNHPINSFAVRG